MCPRSCSGCRVGGGELGFSSSHLALNERLCLRRDELAAASDRCEHMASLPASPELGGGHWGPERPRKAPRCSNPQTGARIRVTSCPLEDLTQPYALHDLVHSRPKLSPVSQAGHVIRSVCLTAGGSPQATHGFHFVHGENEHREGIDRPTVTQQIRGRARRYSSLSWNSFLASSFSLCLSF